MFVTIEKKGLLKQNVCYVFHFHDMTEYEKIVGKISEKILAKMDGAPLEYTTNLINALTPVKDSEYVDDEFHVVCVLSEWEAYNLLNLAVMIFAVGEENIDDIWLDTREITRLGQPVQTINNLMRGRKLGVYEY